MRHAMTLVLAQLLGLAVWLVNAESTSASATTPPKAPIVVVDLAKLGWGPPRFESNRSFFKDFTLAKLFAVDVNTQIVFLNEDVIVAYHTKQEGKDWRTAPRFIEAFFIRAKDGSLLSTHTWPTRPRKAMDDLIDSEARLIPLDGDRFLVVANGAMTLYGSNLDWLRERKLEPSTQSDIWSAQSIPGGKFIVLRHGGKSEPVRYLWLTSDTLEIKHEMQGKGDDNDAIGAVVADENSIFERTRAGIRSIDRNHRVKTICGDPLCRESGNFHVLSGHQLGWSGESGIAIIDTERGGIAWSKTVQPRYRNEFQFGQMCSAISGTRFVLWVTANKKALFDGVEVRSLPTILVYDFTRQQDHPVVIRMKPVEGWWDSALSPDGTKLALFDGAKVQIYSLE